MPLERLPVAHRTLAAMVETAPLETVEGEAVADEVKVGFPTACGVTKRVMLCAGTEALKLLPEKLMSARRLIVFEEVSCQTGTSRSPSWSARHPRTAGRRRQRRCPGWRRNRRRWYRRRWTCSHRSS